MKPRHFVVSWHFIKVFSKVITWCWFGHSSTILFKNGMYCTHKYIICYNRMFYESVLPVLHFVFVYVPMVIVKLWRACFKTVVVRLVYILKFEKSHGDELFFVLFINILWLIIMTYRPFRPDDIILKISCQ